MTDKLSIYNGALRILKERRLSSLTESREPRRLLDDAYGDGRTEGVVKKCLEVGQWVFARRSVRIDYSPSITPDFGYRYAFDHPEDYVRPAAICTDEYFRQPLLQYTDEGSYWYCDLQTIYVTYISNGPTFGTDMSRWPETFVSLVEASAAREIAGNLTNGDKAMQWAEMAYRSALKSAQSMDAMKQPTRFMPAGSWSAARSAGSGQRSRWNGN